MLALYASLVLLHSGNPEPVTFAGLGPYVRKISSKSARARSTFNQGLQFMNGFNHGEAITLFKAATNADPTCAIAYWGIAIANGPNINNPSMDAEHSAAAWKAAKRALQLSRYGSPVERALILAIQKRYAATPPSDRSGLDQAYADAMRSVWHSFPRDPDVGALFAESMMDLRPWNLWTLDGKPQPGTLEIVQTLRSVLRLDARHPQGLHLLIHALEASPHPEQAIVYADRLRFLQPGLGHMVHMPSHIDVRTGRWYEAIAANQRAIRTDAAYRARRKAPTFYRIYMVHNHHMLGYSAMMVGESKVALEAIDQMLGQLPSDWLKAFAPLVDAFVPMPLEARIRFGKWDEVLAQPAYPEYLPLANAVRRYARGIAFAAKGQVAEAKAEQDAFDFAAAAVPEGYSAGNSAAAGILDLCRHMLAGEILLAQDKLSESADELRAGVRAEDRLRYDEPPDWIVPVRHALGAVLTKAGRYAEAESVYREDLRRLPNNGWSLYGLASSLEAQGKGAAASVIRKEFARAWAKADMQIASSCMCVTVKR